MVIPGARSPEQVRGNLEAAELPPLDHDTAEGLRKIYDESIRLHVHHRW